MQYINRKPLQQKPTAHISYHEGLALIRQFLIYASHHTVEEIQAFTSQWVPVPHWVKVDEVTIPKAQIEAAAEALVNQLGHKGIDRVGGSQWWQWRPPHKEELKAEWIEMRGDFNLRKKNGDKGKRVMLYVHGGAYFFGSVDEHRYQLQRHARKLRARVFAPRYRLAPQFPFPCGLFDCLAAYMYLLTVQDPSEIILAGDSAGGGMVVSMLVTIRDRGLPLPAGAVLISPWVDLTHSFPSLSGNSEFDYIPAHGFMQRPSASWPPPNADDMEAMAKAAVGKLAGEALPRHSTQQEEQKAEEEAVQGFSVYENPQNLDPTANPNNPRGQKGASGRAGDTIPGTDRELSIMIDGKLIKIKDQIQMYASNQLISHPLVSPVLTPSLGGLPPLLILTGGGELLRDEQIYLAHKAANPTKYPPGDAYLDAQSGAREEVPKYRPTNVQLQVWDDLCHVAPTLSFTRPAKYMYRSVAQFSAWALARAQKTSIEILDDDDVSIISSGSDTSSGEEDRPEKAAKDVEFKKFRESSSGQVGKAGDPLPEFHEHMIRQRVDRHGTIYPLAHAKDLPALQVPAAEVGVIKPGPVQKWITAKKEWDTKYASEKRRVQKKRVAEMIAGYESFGNDEVPPPSALAGRRAASTGKAASRPEKKKRSWGMTLWSLWGGSHDKHTIEREEAADRNPETEIARKSVEAIPATNGASRPGATRFKSDDAHSRSRSRRRTVTDQGQTNGMPRDENTTIAQLMAQEEKANDSAAPYLSLDYVPKLRDPDASENASMKVQLGDEDRTRLRGTMPEEASHKAVVSADGVLGGSRFDGESTRPGTGRTEATERPSVMGRPSMGERLDSGTTIPVQSPLERPSLGERFDTAQEAL